MGFFSNWPFSNLHNLNLDWLIEQVKKLTVLSDQIWERVKPLPGGDPSTVTAAQAYGAASYAQQTAEQAGQSAKTANTAIDNHVANKNNPHGVTAKQIGAEPAFTLLNVEKGGTGGYNPETARASLNARKDFKILPVAEGGTGSSTAAGARDALGITPANIGAKPAFDVLPIAQGGTGANSAASARVAIGAKANFTVLPMDQGGTGANTAADAVKNINSVVGNPARSMLMYTNLEGVGLVSQSCTTAELVLTMPTNSSISFVHIAEQSLKITDAPENYGFITLNKGHNNNYVCGWFHGTTGNIFHYKYNTVSTGSNGWKKIVTE